MKYLLTDIDDQSVYMTGQFFRDSAINPCIKSSYLFVQHIMQQVIDMHKARYPCFVTSASLRRNLFRVSAQLNLFTRRVGTFLKLG